MSRYVQLPDWLSDSVFAWHASFSISQAKLTQLVVTSDDRGMLALAAVSSKEVIGDVWQCRASLLEWL